MKHVLLINRSEIPHYRVPVYNYLSDYLINNDIALSVVSEGIQKGKTCPVTFDSNETPLNIVNLLRLIVNKKPDVIIFWVNPALKMWIILYTAKLMKIKVIHWGHRRPLPPNVPIKNIIYNVVEHGVDDAIILYAEHLREHVWRCFQSKIFIANNTLNLSAYKPLNQPKEDVKARYGITTHKNIICVGRMQRRKRIGDLLQAFNKLELEDVGLILVGPDDEGILRNIESQNIFKLGPVYGDAILDLLSAADVYCLPGAVGLSIVDAFYCGLPLITEDIVHGPEIMYLKDGINGFMVHEGDINQLTAKLKVLLTDDVLRDKFSQAARQEIMTNGHIDRMCEGFLNAIQYACR